MKDFSLNNISRVLTAKERAKLIANYAIKEELEGKDYEHEIEAIKAGIPDTQINEYNFYVSLVHTLQVVMDADLQTMTLFFQCFEAKLDCIYRLLRFSIMADVLLLQLRWLPKVVTEEGFEQLYCKLRDEEFSAIFSIESLAEQETLAQLKSQGELQDWHADEVQTALKNGSFYLTQEWKTELGKQQAKIQQWINEGKLEGKEVISGGGYYSTKADIGKQGVTARSWYDHKEKLDKDFNNFIDNKKALVHFCENDVAIDYSPFTEGTAERTKTRMKEIVERMAFIKREREKDYFDVTLTLNPILKEQMEDIFRQIVTMRLKMEAYINATQRVEACYFDGQEMVGQEVWFGTKAKKVYQSIEDNHKETFDDLLKYFGRFSQDKITFEYPKPLDVSEQAESIKEQSDELVQTMVDKARKQSGFSPLHFPS
jgi:hypothetical protein